MYRIIGIHDERQKREITQKILQALPRWFGIPEAVWEYVQGVVGQPFFAVSFKGEMVGFLSLKKHNPYTAEIYVMGVEEAYQRQGYGRALMEEAKHYLQKELFKYLMVKTLGPSRDDENYSQTRLFYYHQGFYPLEELKGLWDENNPCLILIKSL